MILPKRILIHTFAGCLAGMIVLHPLAMFINDIVEYKLVHFIFLKQMFSSKHLIMTLYYGLLGGILGVFNALYAHKKASLYEKIEMLSITDEMTTLYNRRYLFSQLKNEIERAQRYSYPLSILMMDLNNFKIYNDTYGHQYGDEVLKSVAILFKNSVRKSDFVVRFGGDEFVIVMPEADKDRALNLAERLSKEVENLAFPSVTSAQQRKNLRVERLKISIGTATFPADAQHMDGLITKADSQLYVMKNETAKFI